MTETTRRNEVEILPVRRGLDVGALARLFDDATNSYKHLFFRALL